MSSIGVYVIANNINRKVYVGASRNIRTRFAAHRASLKNGTHPCESLQKDWETFGEDNFQFKILELSDGKNYVLVERKYIKGFASLGADCLYNKSGVPKAKKQHPKKQFRRTGHFSSDPTI